MDKLNIQATQKSTQYYCTLSLYHLQSLVSSSSFSVHQRLEYKEGSKEESGEGERYETREAAKGEEGEKERG